MIKSLIFDFSMVLLLPKDKEYSDSLNKLHRDLSVNQEYNFLDHFELNEELVNYLTKIKDKVELYIFTTETIQESPEVAPVLEKLFLEIFSALRLNLSKKDPLAYKTIIQKIHKKPEEVLFIDDTLSNVEAAREADLKTLHYQSNKQLFEKLNQLDI
jgi:HAD superfamily hydrolase (TIGR01509 family)